MRLLINSSTRAAGLAVAAIGMGTLLLGLGAATAHAEDEGSPEPLLPPVTVLKMNRDFNVLPVPIGSDYRPTLRAAAAHFEGGLSVNLAGVVVDQALLVDLAETSAVENLGGRAREKMRRAVDVLDFCYFLDDVIAQNAQARGDVVLTPSRARGVGVFMHPDEVFRGRARDYGKITQVPVEPPVDDEWQPPSDGSALGPAWHARFPNPDEEEPMLAALAQKRPEADFADRVRMLIEQLRLQGAEVVLESTVRQRERGYLMYGAFWLSQARTGRQVRARARALSRLERRWKLDVDILWRHKRGWRATRDEARRMAEAYNVVYATRSGAMRSHHYDGEAVDFVATGLPRELVLTAPDGSIGYFDLRHPEEPLDLSLTPIVIDWVREHFRIEKHLGDYPHWNDADREP